MDPNDTSGDSPDSNISWSQFIWGKVLSVFPGSGTYFSGSTLDSNSPDGSNFLSYLEEQVEIAAGQEPADENAPSAPAWLKWGGIAVLTIAGVGAVGYTVRAFR